MFTPSPANTARAAYILRRAADLIAAPANWTKGVSARDASGRHADRMYADAVSYCAIGATECAWQNERRRHAEGIRCLNSWEPSPMTIAMHYLTDSLPEGHRISGVLYYNDAPGTTHVDILAVFQRAIERVDAAVAAFAVANRPVPVAVSHQLLL